MLPLVNIGPPMLPLVNGWPFLSNKKGAPFCALLFSPCLRGDKRGVYFTSTIFLVCAISPASSRHKYTPDGKPEASNIIWCRPAV